MRRIFVEKKQGFRVEADTLKHELNHSLGINITALRLINIYDLFEITDSLVEKSIKNVFSEVVTDNVLTDFELGMHLAVEYLPGQFDQRADSAMQCIGLIDPSEKPVIRTGKLYLFEGLSLDELARVKKYVINPVEAREKDMSVLKLEESNVPEAVEVLHGFRMIQHDQLRSTRTKMGLAMSIDDLAFTQEHFRSIDRDPTITEVRVLDTYWSDHCRHTTFETEIKNVKIITGQYSEKIEEAFKKYLRMKESVASHKPMTLMDLATISTRLERSRGNLDDLEVSEEINACSVYVDIDVDGVDEEWLLMFKNETHNHPTEIEPFGGASTCVGGAIRDPLSGRSYVYQAMRVTGGANPLGSLEDTLEGKLPQSTISKVSAEGYSSYGNQIGLATTHVKEIYHPGYMAKHMEVGAVVGAVKADSVVRESPVPGDIVVMFGGRTGRDGIGGATGSSKEHNEESIETASAEVQKGNAPEERKIQRLFRKSHVTKLIKKSNDFGAGGVSVAIGELSDSLEINLDNVRTKYDGLNGTELAISESQERMSVVIEAENFEEFTEYCHEENLEAYKIADITDTGRLVMKWRGQVIVDLERSFLNTNGVRQRTNVIVDSVAPFEVKKRSSNVRKEVLEHMHDINISTNIGMIEMFDSSVGASTVLMPLGGKYQLTESQASVHKFPVLDGFTKACSIMSFGFNPYISEWSPFHGSKVAIIDSISKVVAVGGDYKSIRFSFQEYFERMVDARSYGKPFSALLGAVDCLEEFGLAAIGGKDSMSGTFKDINVPPTLISFAVAKENVDKIVSNEFKGSNNFLYLLKPKRDGLLPRVDSLISNFEYIKSINPLSMNAVTNGGLVEVLVKASLGNKVGFDIESDDLFDVNYGAILIESDVELEHENLVALGRTNGDIRINGELFGFGDFTNVFKELYPETPKLGFTEIPEKEFSLKSRDLSEVKVLIPVFPGMNSEYDMYKSFTEAGGSVTLLPFKNLTSSDIEESIQELALEIKKADIFAISGGFSAGDEPDGSGKFIANILLNETIKEAMEVFLEKDGLVLGICNGFQALIKSGLINGEIGNVTEDSATLFRNDCSRHISSITTTKVVSNLSPWLYGFKPGQEHKVAISHGEGKFVASKEVLDELIGNGQVAFQYTEETGNPNGSVYSIEGITSKCGRILGKMSHSERTGYGVYKNIPGDKDQNIFKNAISYLKGE